MVRSFALALLTALAATAPAQDVTTRPARTPQAPKAAAAPTELQEELAELRAELRELRAVLAEIHRDRRDQGEAKGQGKSEDKFEGKSEAKGELKTAPAPRSATKTEKAKSEKAKGGEESKAKGRTRVRVVTSDGSPVEVIEVSPGSGTYVVGPEGVRALTTVEEGVTTSPLFVRTPAATDVVTTPAPTSSGCTCTCPCCQGQGAAKTQAQAPVRARTFTPAFTWPQTTVDSFTLTQPVLRNLFTPDGQTFTFRGDRNCAPARTALRGWTLTPATPATPEAQAAPVAPPAPKAPKAPKTPKVKKTKPVTPDRTINV